MKTVGTILLLSIASATHIFAEESVDRGFLRVEGKRFVFTDGSVFLPRGFTMGSIAYVDSAGEFEEFWGMTPGQWLDKLAGAGLNLFRINVPHQPERDDAEFVERNLGWLLEECQKRGIYVCLGIQHGINSTQTDAFRQRADFYIEHFGEHRSLAMWELQPQGTQQAVEELALYLKEADPHSRPVGTVQRGSYYNEKRIDGVDWASSEVIDWLIHSAGNQSFRIGLDDVFLESRIALLGRESGLSSLHGPGPLGLRPGRHDPVDITTPGFDDGQFNTVSLRHEFWCGAGMFAATLERACPFGQDKELLRERFDDVLDAMTEFAGILRETVEADRWGGVRITKTPGWDQHVMVSDGRHVLMHCCGQLDGGTRGYMGFRIPMPDLQPGRYEVRWYSLLTGKLLSVNEERIGDPEKYEVPAVTSPRGPVILYVRPIEITPYVEREGFDESKLAARLLELTGGRRAKIAWNGHTASPGSNLQVGLIVFDTGEGKSRLLAEGLNLAFITADGSAVIANEMKDGINYGCRLISWDGEENRKLLEGRYAFALSTWRDPETGIEWLYVGDNNSTPWNESEGRTDKVYRHRLDDLEHRELVWDAGFVGPWFYLSADGKYAGGAFPFNRMGVADLAAGTWREYGRGCDGAIAPDDSYQFFHLEGNHRAISFYDFGGRNRRSIAVNNQPAVAERDSAWLTSWSSDVRFLTCMAPEHGNSDIYMGRFDENFTRIEKWVRITANEAGDGGSYAWIEPAVDDQTAGGRVNSRVLAVLDLDEPQREIEALLAAARSDDEAQAREASQILQRLEGYASGELERIEAASIGDPDEAAGRYREFAQRFNGLDASGNAQTLLQQLEKRWPVQHRGLVFMWKTADNPALALDSQGRQIQNFSLSTIGDARLDRFYNMIPRSGGFRADGADEQIAAAARHSNAFTFQCRITMPQNITDGETVIIRWENNFSITQQGGRLTLNINTSDGVATMTLPAPAAGESSIITLVFNSGKMELYSNGRQSAEGNARGDLSTWQSGPLVFGSNSAGQPVWQGKLEGIAIWAAALDGDTIARDVRRYTEFAAGREQAAPIETIRIRGKLAAKSPTPAFDEIAPYTRNLSVYEYEVQEVISGNYGGGKIYVAHWTLMDRKPTPAARRSVGQTFELTVQPFASHPQLEPERLADTLDYLLDFDLYYDIAE